ncbi:flavodoxin domain-containing protein [Brevibacterium daeguense]|uniref:Flavodoxin domain-containing protein n=1 Tax=Brevibacterium daeguense TaxID=909936 RepID=A0ABP8EJL8_9MICO|nr:flavodoxin domain-containing protein [Brevibacterium daeguense]
MRTLVVYTSKTGFTKTYAEWIAEDLGAEIVRTQDLSREQLASADVVIHGGGLRASRIEGLRTFLRHWPLLKGKHVALWHTGANPGRPETVEGVWEQNLTPEQLERTTRFYLRGGFDFTRLRGVDRLVMSIMRFVLKRKKNPSADDRGMLAMYEHPTTELSRENTAPLVNHVRSLDA